MSARGVRALALALLAAALWGCGQRVPPDKLAYVGEWKMVVDGVELTRTDEL